MNKNIEPGIQIEHRQNRKFEHSSCPVLHSARAAQFEGSSVVTLRYLAFALCQDGTTAATVLASSGINVVDLRNRIANIAFLDSYADLVKDWTDIGLAPRKGSLPSREEIMSLPKNADRPRVRLPEIIHEILRRTKSRLQVSGANVETTADILLTLLNMCDDVMLTSVFENAGVTAANFRDFQRGYTGPTEQ